MMAEKKPLAVPSWFNRVMAFILRSPLHGLVSSKIMLITFTGRKSGRSYTTPVSYMQNGDTITVFTHGTWWMNCRSGAPVRLRIRGQDRSGSAQAIVEDKDAIADALAQHLRTNHMDARAYGVTYDVQGNPKPDEVRRGVQDAVMLRVKLA